MFFDLRSRKYQLVNMAIQRSQAYIHKICRITRISKGFFANFGHLFPGLVFIVLSLTALSRADIKIVTDTGTTVLDIADFQIQFRADGQVYFEGTEIQSIGDTGQPQLPWQVFTVLLPPDTLLSGISCEIEESVYESIEGTWQVGPIPPAATRDENNRIKKFWPNDKEFVDGKELQLYESDMFWPIQPVRIVHRGNLDQANLIQIAVALVRYNPQQHQLQQFTDIRLQVSEQTLQSSAQQASTRKSQGKLRNLIRSRLQKLAVNYDLAAADYDDASEGISSTSDSTEATSLGTSDVQAAANLSATGYAIITTNAVVNISTQLSSFIAHKEAQGFTVYLITEDDFGGGTGQTSADNLRNWLRSNYLSLDLLYVLLIGNPHPTAGTLAMKMVYDGDHPTDYYFAELTGDWDSNGNGIYGEQSEMDKFFEVFVGRIPYYGTIADTDSVLQKIMTYENSTNAQWRRNVLLPMVPLDDVVTSHELGEQIKGYLLEPEEVPSDRIYDETYGVIPPPEYIRSNSYPATVWSQNKYGLVVWQTHGWDDNASGIINNGDVWTLNDSYPAVAWQGSCRNAYAENSDTLAWRLLKNGAVATLGATRNSYYWAGQTWYVGTPSIGGMGYEFAKRIMQDKPCGQAFYEMKEALDVSNLIQNFYVFNLYGDPSLIIMPDKPALTISATDAFYVSGRSHTTPETDSRIYTLYNNSDVSLSWDASCFADWVSLSQSSGTIAAQGSMTVEIQLNNNMLNLPTGKHTTSVLFNDLTNEETLTREVILDLLANRLRGHWRLDETTGDVAYDSSGSLVDGSLQGCTFDSGSVTGKFGSALRFDGSDDYIALPTIQSGLTDGLTVSVWAYPTSVRNWARFIDFGNGSSSDNILFSRRSTTNNLVLEVWNGSTSGGYVTATDAIELNTWQMFSTTVDMSGAAKIYKNGELIASGTTGVPANVERQSNYFGKSNWSADSYYKGYMDDIWIYNRVLDSSEIWNLYIGGPAEAPYPADCEATALRNIALSWDGGYGALSYEVYFGTKRDAVDNATTDSPEYQGHLAEEEYVLENLIPNRQYYWRIDKNIYRGFIRGDIWTFYATDAVGLWQFADEKSETSPWTNPTANGSFAIGVATEPNALSAENSDGFACQEGAGTSFGEITDIPAALNDAAAGSMTMFARIRFASFSGIDDIWRMGKGACSAANGLGFGGQETFALELSSGRPRFVVSSDGQVLGSEFETMITHATTLQADKWYDVTGVFTADPDTDNPEAQGTLKIYIFDPLTAEEVGSSVSLAVDFDALETDWTADYSRMNVLFLEAPCNGNETNTDAQIELAALWSRLLDYNEIASLSIPVSEPPYFINNPVSGSDAYVAYPYAANISFEASDPDANDVLSFFKVDGLDWVSVETDGQVTGTPEAADEGLNTIDLRVCDNRYRCAVGTMEVNVLLLDFADGGEGMSDFGVLGSYWLATDCAPCGGADLNGDYSVGMDDLMIFASNWLGDL